MKYITPNGLMVEMVGADETDDPTEYSVYIGDSDGEIVMWTADEWIEDPSVVASVVNAIMLGATEGPVAVRRRTARTR